MSIRPRTAALKWEEEPFHFTCDLSSTKLAQVTVISRECLACSLSLKGEWMHIPFSLSTVHVFRRLPKELVSFLPDCHSLVPGATKSKGGIDCLRAWSGVEAAMAQWNREKAPNSLLLPWEEGKKVEHMSQDSGFLGRLPKELVSISAHSRHVSQHALDARGPLRIKEWRVACSCST